MIVRAQWRSLDLARWVSCFMLALLLHIGGTATLLKHWQNEPDVVANAPIITVELAPVAVAPQIQPTELPPGPQQPEAESQSKPEKPPDQVELPLEPKADQALSVMPSAKPPEKAKEEKLRQNQASLPTAPSTSERKGQRAAAPAPGAASQNPYAVKNWKSRLVAKLEGSKRYPAEARAHHEEGVVQLAFTIDRNGGVRDARIMHTSGSPLLDRETLAMLERAQPLPPPPPEIHDAQIAIVVPIRYNIR